MKPNAFPEFEDGQLREFLQHEIAQQKERNQRATVLSVMIIVLVTVYMSFISYSVSTNFLDPTSAAQWLSYVAEENLPEFMEDTQRELTTQAPAAADHLMTGLILNVPGYVADRAREQIDSVVDEQLPYIQEEMQTVMLTFLADSLADSESLLQIQKDPAFAKVFVDQLVTDVTAALDTELKKQGVHGLSDVMSVSLAALETINGQLAQLESTEAGVLTYEDELQRKLILSCLQIMDELLGQVEESGQPLFAPGTFESF